MKGFRGFLLTDGYAGYNMVPNVEVVACLAHVRSKFDEAKTAVGKDTKSVRYIKAKEGFDYCSKLFKLEEQWKDLSIEERFNKRQEEMKPLLDAFLTWLKEIRKAALPKSKLGDAVTYAINQWPKRVCQEFCAFS